MTAVGRSMSSRTYVLKCKAEINSKTENFCSVKQEAYLSKILGYGASKFKPIFHAENFQANLKRKNSIGCIIMQRNILNILKNLF